MPTLQRAKQLAKVDRLQVHWVVPGLIANAYNVANSTSYALHWNSEKYMWICTCIWAQTHPESNETPCKHVAAVISKIERETALI